jgi:hypothetical protein
LKNLKAELIPIGTSYLKTSFGADDDGFRYFLARWQPDAFMLRQLLPQHEAQSGTNLSGDFLFSCGSFSRLFGRCTTGYFSLSCALIRNVRSG